MLASTLTDTSRSLGTEDEVDPVERLISAVATWGGNPQKDAVYLNFTSPKNDGTIACQLRIKDVPIEGFWSVIVYDKEGYISQNASRVYSFNNLTAKPDADGTTTIQFGGDSAKAIRSQ